MSSGKTIRNNPNTNIILVNTAIDTNVIVSLENPIPYGQSLTVRDNSGQASSNNTITITSPTNDFITTINNISNELVIVQPYGYATFQYGSTEQWTITNTFGYSLSNTTFSINSFSVNTINFTDIQTGTVAHLNVSNGIMKLNGENIIGTAQSSVIDTINANSLSASNLILSSNVLNPTITQGETSTRLTVSGTTQTNFLTLVGVDPNVPVSLSAQSNTVYRGNYPLFPIGGYIEFAYRNDNYGTYYALSTYPLYLGTLANISNGWWDRNLVSPNQNGPINSFVSGFITLPGFHLIASSNGTIICNTCNNTSQMPIYSNVNRPETASQHRYFEASYVLTAIS